MLVIRYFRIGKKNQPYFKIVVTDQRMPVRGGRFVEEVGFSDPVKKKRTLKADRIKYWISKGAQPSDSIHNLLISEKIIEGKKIDVHNKKKVKEGPSTSSGQAPVVKPAEPTKVEVPKEEIKKEEPKIDAPVEEKKIAAPEGGEPRSDSGREPPKEEISAPVTEEKK